MRPMKATAADMPDDEALVAAARRGVGEAFGELIERHKTKAYRIAFDFTRNREDARDLSQEAFLKAFTNLNRFDGRASFYTWFYRILVNLCLDYKRRGAGRRHETLDAVAEDRVEAGHRRDPSGAPDARLMAEQFSARVDAALDALPPRQRTAFILKNHQGLTIQEIAEVMESAEGTVKVHLHRAVRNLRRSLADFAPGEL